MVWQKTEEEYIAAAIVRALRRDPVANRSNGTRPWIQSLADRIEQNKIKVTVVEE